MDTINKVKSISIWIFIVPFVAINTCLILITNFHEIFPNKEHIIHNTIPYIDGGLHQYMELYYVLYVLCLEIFHESL